MSRLDMFITSEATLDYINRCVISPGCLSDHSIVEMVVQLNSTNRGPGLWKLNTSHLKDHKFVEGVNDIIFKQHEASGSVTDYGEMWDNLKREVTNFAKKYSKSKALDTRNNQLALERKVKTWTTKLHMINLKADNAISLINNINDKIDTFQKELDKINMYKTQGVILRSRARWIEQGEKNTKYFFGLEKHTARANTMNRCIDEKGHILTNPQEIVFEQARFYERLYTKQENVHFVYKNRSAPIVIATQKILLDSDYVESEFANAIKSMASQKCPGSDGLPVEFYKVFWSRLSPLFMLAFQQAQKTHTLHESARIGIISLIPKKNKQRDLISNWRPISLLNVDYKIISKAVAQRLKCVLPHLIHEDQTGFMQGRLITENIRKVLDVINHCKNKKSSNAIAFVPLKTVHTLVNIIKSLT